MWLETISGAIINSDLIVYLGVSGDVIWRITAYEPKYGGEDDYEYYYLGEFESRQEAEQELSKMKELLNAKQ